MHRLLDGFPVAPPDGSGNDDVRPQGDADEQIDQQPDHSAVGADGGHGCRPVRYGKIPHHGQVRRVKELLQDRRGGDGQRKTRQLAPDRAVEHIQFLACFAPAHKITPSLPFLHALL